MVILAFFLKKHWRIVGDDVCYVVLNFVEEGRMLQNTNHTLIILIPKVRTVRDLCSIGLCNLIYKIISKILMSRH